MYVLNYVWQEWIWEGNKILFSEWDVGDGVSLGPNQDQHRDYLDWASAAHGGGADACCCCGQFPGNGGVKAHSIHVLRGLHDQQRSLGRADGCQKLDEHITSEFREFLDFCNRFVTTLDQSLISGAKDDTSAMIFWLKTNADFFRYQTECLTDPARIRTAGQAAQCYEEALSTAGVEFPAPNSVWLAVAFNYSVFLFETQRQSKQAVSVARTVLEESAGLTDSVNETEFKEATRLP
jgi:hypothetical protein